MPLLLFFFFSLPGNDVGLLHEKVFRKENLLTVNVGKTKTLKESTAEGLVRSLRLDCRYLVQSNILISLDFSLFSQYQVALVEQLTSVHAHKTVSVFITAVSHRVTNDGVPCTW